MFIQENVDFSFPPPERSQNTPFPLSCETPNIAKVNTSQKEDLNISENRNHDVTIMNEIFLENFYVTNETRRNENFNCSDEAQLFDESFLKDLGSDFVESPSIVNSYKFVEGDPKTRKLQDDTSKLNGSFLTRERIREDSLSVLVNGSRYSMTVSENQVAPSKQIENKSNEDNAYSSATSRKRTSLLSSESSLSSFNTSTKSKSPRKPFRTKIKQRSLMNSSSLKQVQLSSDESLSDMETTKNGSFAAFTKSRSSPFLSSSSKRKTNENVLVRSSGKKQRKQRKAKQARKEKSREEFKALVKSVAAARCSQDVTSESNEEW